MSRFSILRVDHFDPVAIGRKNRRLYTIYGILPLLLLSGVNIISSKWEHYGYVFLLTFIFFIPLAIILTKKTRKNNEKLKPIGEAEITRSYLRKRISDSVTETDYKTIRTLTLSKHMPSTSPTESKGRYYSYILKTETIDGEEDTFIVADRSLDQDHKLSVLDTIKTLKKIVNFEIIIDV